MVQPQLRSRQSGSRAHQLNILSVEHVMNGFVCHHLQTFFIFSILSLTAILSRRIPLIQWRRKLSLRDGMYSRSPSWSIAKPRVSRSVYLQAQCSCYDSSAASNYPDSTPSLFSFPLHHRHLIDTLWLISLCTALILDKHLKCGHLKSNISSIV